MQGQIDELTKQISALKFDLDYQQHQYSDEKARNEDLLSEINELHKSISDYESKLEKTTKAFQSDLDQKQHQIDS